MNVPGATVEAADRSSIVSVSCSFTVAGSYRTKNFEEKLCLKHYRTMASSIEGKFPCSNHCCNIKSQMKTYHNTGELKNCDLFLVWRSVHGDLKLKADLITQEIMVHYALDDIENTRSEIEKCAYNLSKYFSKLWEKYHRKEKSVLKHEYFSKVFVLPQSVVIKLPSTSSEERGRKKLPFSESSDCVKRRKTAQLRTEHSADELTFASVMKLREEGKRAEASIIKIATQSTPTRATRMLKSVRSTPPATCVSYSSEEALALICDTQLTVAQYTKLRLEAKSRNANLYPAYKKILEAKRSCYPEKNSITITETNMEIKLQALLDHTVERIILTKENIINNFSDEDLQNLLFTVKYGYDGSGDHAEYKQIFSNDDGTASDSHIFATSIVPINIVVGGKILFENPRPSSTRFCRPLRLQFAKETALLIAAEKASLDSQIAELQPVTVECFGRSALVKFKMLMTMVDGKVCNAVTSTSSQRCYICGATPSQMNNLNTVRKREENVEAFQFGLSILHAYIRFFEYLLHLSYRLDMKKWQIRTAEHKQIMLDKKKYIQSRFKTEIGLIVDKPRSGGCGNSNDGNTARRFFQNWEQSAQITGINRQAIYRCKIILETLVSGNEKTI